MTITAQQLKLIHVACRKVHLPDDAYRSALAQIAGVTSSTELDRDGFDAMMGLFQYLGFEPAKAQGQNFGARPGMASFAQIELIRALWQEHTSRQAGEAELNKCLLRCFKVSSLRFLTAEAAPRSITALKAMKARARAE